MIKHVLADGTEVDSIEGMLIPTTGPTAAVYRIIADFAKNRPHTQKEQEMVTHANTTAKRAATKRR